MKENEEIGVEQEAKVLHLTLVKKWFDLIGSRVKKEEYRELNLYWYNRLVANPKDTFEYFTGLPFEQATDELVRWLCTNKAPFIQFREFEEVRFRNGYAKSAPVLTPKWEGIRVGDGREEWGAKEGKAYFVIKLGELTEEKSEEEITN